jgi:hypothetical protein
VISCSSQRRRELLDRSPLLGIDFVEIDPTDKRRLHAYLLDKPEVVAPTPTAIAESIDRRNVKFIGGTRRTLTARSVEAATDDFGIEHLVIVVERLGDRSSYRLVIEDERFDRRLNTATFSFAATCSSIGDCAAPKAECPPETGASPPIDYLAKDYASFRQLLVDHMDAVSPAWGGAHPADFTTAILEVLAYEGDRLSYMQDVVANERTLRHARLRESAVRHARLVDYHADNGSSARTFLRIAVSGPVVVEPGGRAFTRVTDPSIRVRPGLTSAEADVAADIADESFLVLPRTRTRGASAAERSWRLDASLNSIAIHTWGEDVCCLPTGSTSAVLAGDLSSRLAVGDFLGMREARGLRAEGEAGRQREADPDKVFVVKLTKVALLPADVVAHDSGEPLTQVTWDDRDALSRPLCVTDGDVQAPVAEAFGNLVLVEHGRAASEDLDLPDDLADEPRQWPEVYRQRLATPGLLVSRDDGVPPPCRAPRRRSLDLEGEALDSGFVDLSASHHLDPNPRSGPARVGLRRRPDGIRWTQQESLLLSGSNDQHFVVEIDDDGRGWIRFGDDDRGSRPAEADGTGSGIEFDVDYCIGDPVAGNVGADTLGHVEVASGPSAVISVTNPVAAAGGRRPESIASIKDNAPRSLRETRRAVRTEDYAGFATRETSVQRARARFEWTGSWTTVSVVADAQGATALADADAQALQRCLDSVRLAGYPVQIDRPAYVPLDVILAICVERGHEPYEVLAEVAVALGSGCDEGGRLGFFHPDRLTFGQPIWLSDIVASAASVDGVSSVRPRRFQRLYARSSDLRRGVIPMHRTEIARLDNDDARPENGSLRLDLVTP